MCVISNKTRTLFALLMLAILPLLSACDEVSVVVAEGDIDAGLGGEVDPPDILPPGSPILVSLDDVNGDGIQDIAVVIDDAVAGKVTASVKDINGRLVKNIAYSGKFRLLHALALPDMNGDGAMELAVFSRHQDTGDLKAEIRDPLTGGLTRNILYSNEYEMLFATLTPDLNGDSYPEITVVLEGDTSVGSLFGQSKDPLTGGAINNVFFDNQYAPVHFISLPDINSSGSPEFAILGQNANGEYRSLVRDAGNSQLVNSTSYGNQYTVSQMAVMPDMDGNALEELAVLRRANSVTIQINDAFSGARVSVVRFNPLFTPLKFVVMSDVNSNGSPELAVLGRNPDTGSSKAEMRDAESGNLIANVWWSQEYPAFDIVAIPDTNGNGAEELVALGKRASDGKLLVLIKDSKTNDLLGTVGFPIQP